MITGAVESSSSLVNALSSESMHDLLLRDALEISRASSHSNYILPRVTDWKNLDPALTFNQTLKVGSTMEFDLELDYLSVSDSGLIKSEFTEDVIVKIKLQYDTLFGDKHTVIKKKFSSADEKQIVEKNIKLFAGDDLQVVSKMIKVDLTIPITIEDMQKNSTLEIECKIMNDKKAIVVKGFPIDITERYKKKKKPMLGFDMLYCTNVTASDSSFSYPLDVTIYQARNIFYVTDTYNKRIAIFDLNTKEFKFHIYPKAYPRCLVVSEIDDCIIFTCDDNYVYKYNYDGSKLIWQSFPELNWPRGLVIDPTNEDIYICDFDNHRIQVISKTGDILRHFGSKGSGEGEFHNPKDIDFDLNGNLVVSDRENHRLLVLSKQDGSLVRKIENGQGSLPGQFSSQEGFCIDRTNGNIIVCDSMNDRIQIFNSKLEFLTSFGEAGFEKSELTKPTGCALDDKRQELLVVEWNNQRLQVFRYPLTSKNAKQTQVKLFKTLHSGKLSDVFIVISDLDM